MRRMWLGREVVVAGHPPLGSVTFHFIDFPNPNPGSAGRIFKLFFFYIHLFYLLKLDSPETSQTGDRRKQSRRQTEDSRQQTEDSRLQTVDSRLQTCRQKKIESRHKRLDSISQYKQTEDSGQQTIDINSVSRNHTVTLTVYLKQQTVDRSRQQTKDRRQ